MNIWNGMCMLLCSLSRYGGLKWTPDALNQAVYKKNYLEHNQDNSCQKLDRGHLYSSTDSLNRAHLNGHSMPAIQQIAFDKKFEKIPSFFLKVKVSPVNSLKPDILASTNSLSRRLLNERKMAAIGPIENYFSKTQIEKFGFQTKTQDISREIHETAQAWYSADSAYCGRSNGLLLQSNN